MIAVTNTVGSSLAREADGVLYTHAGPEICVAATKTFATQMVSQYLVALYLAQVRGRDVPRGDRRGAGATWTSSPTQVARAIGLDDRCRALAERYAEARDRAVHRPAHRATRPRSRAR